MQLLASLVLAIHLLWILWVVFGALFTRRHAFFTALHLLSLVWGFIVELSPWPCPLSLTEQFFEQKAGLEPYRGAFLTHFLDRIVYPDFPESVLIIGGVAVCAANLGIYMRRYARWSRCSKT